MDKSIQLELNFSESLRLRESVETYFAGHLYKGFVRPFKLSRLETSGLKEDIIYAVPENGEELLDEEDPEWHEGLLSLGRSFGIELRIPYWCYVK